MDVALGILESTSAELELFNSVDDVNESTIFSRYNAVEGMEPAIAIAGSILEEIMALNAIQVRRRVHGNREYMFMYMVEFICRWSTRELHGGESI
jgi:hypothetical protein